MNDIDKAIAAQALKDTITGHRAHVRWLTWCSGLHAALQAAGVYELDVYPHGLAIAVERTYMAANKKPAMPSKNRKLQTYSHARRAARFAGVEVESISTLEDIADVIARVTAALAVT